MEASTVSLSIPTAARLFRMASLNSSGWVSMKLLVELFLLKSSTVERMDLTSSGLRSGTNSSNLMVR